MKTTAFTKYHIAAGAKMAEFAGYNMPIEFTGINDEHMAVRNGAGVFDVSHMGEIWVKGPKALDLLQRITTNDVSKLFDGKVQYSCMPNGHGGIVDDILVYRVDAETYMLCVNAANIEKDEPIGFFITVPDLNRIIGKFNGKFGLIQKLRLMWELKVRKSCDRIFGIIFGIAPEFHGKGVESAIMARYWHFMMGQQSRYKTLELAWIGDFNPVMNRMIETYVCATRHKIHTTYRYLFDRTKEFHRCPRLGVKRRE